MTYFNIHTATLYVTNKCNFKCDFCYRQHNVMDEFEDMNIDIVAALYNKIPTIRGVCICGYGETLMADNLFEIIKYSKLRKKFIGLISNGSLIHKYKDQLKANKPNYISISINASNKEKHTKITKSNTFDQVLQNIRLCKELGITTYVSFVCHKQNYKDVEPFLKLMNNYNIDGIHLHNILPHFKDNTNFFDLVITENDIEILNEIKNYPFNKKVKTYPKPIKLECNNFKCHFPNTMIAIDGNGSISICNSVYPCQKINGNIKDINVLFNEYCDKFRHQTKINMQDACKLCFRNF